MSTHMPTVFTRACMAPPIHTHVRISSSEASEAPSLFHSTKSCFFISSSSCMGRGEGGGRVGGGQKAPI